LSKVQKHSKFTNRNGFIKRTTQTLQNIVLAEVEVEVMFLFSNV